QFSKPFGSVVDPQRVSPRGTGFVKKLYMLEGVSRGSSSLLEENFFKPIDDRGAIVLKKFECGQKVFDGAERVAWTQFILSLLFRHPENVAAVKSRLFDTLTKTSASAEWRWRRQRKPGDASSLHRAMHHEIEQDPAQVQRQALQVVADLAASERIGTPIAKMFWGSTLLPLSVEPLFSSDRPVLKFGGLDDAGCHILMPIGPRRIFWAANSREMANTIMMRAHAPIAGFINQQTVRRAVRYVYAMSDNRLTYVQENMSVEPDPSSAEMIAMLDRRSALRRMKRTFNPAGWKAGA
ncbi:DUF4238 domain-containing protein, partial [Methylobacterium sp. GC_Met_2]|uniref:DUF4238 domain-containing protein n=1 Tax=Methylobacterium sp. GC_Met_2 TaxID=2937376 RepID=UPI00226B31D1